MKPFTGFSPDSQKSVGMPEEFFSVVLPQITSMLEMKVTLYLLRRLAATDGGRRTADDRRPIRGNRPSALDPLPPTPSMVSLDELEADAELRGALSQSKGPRSYTDALREGLELAVARGTLLQVAMKGDDALQTTEAIDSTTYTLWFLLNTRANRVWLEALGKGEIDITETPLIGYHLNHTIQNPKPKIQNRYQVIVERPSIYTLYEQNIGLLTPILAEKLQEVESRYPTEWIESAFEEAVTNNKRNWRYIERILERWAVEGREEKEAKGEKGSGKARGPAERALDPEKYTRGKYAFLFRPER